MMRLPPFRYVAARTLAEATGALAEHGGAAMPVAGGTDLFPNMKRRQIEPRVLVGLSGIAELRGVAATADGGVRVGAMTTLTALARHDGVARGYAGLATAAGVVSSPQLRNVGTLGGNLCVDTRCNYYNQSHAWRKAVGFCMKKDGDICLVAPGSPRCWAVSSSDTAPALWSLGARVRLVSPRGEREIPIAGLYRDDGIQYLSRQPDEVLTDVLLPPAGGWRSTYLKLRRRGSFDFPVLGVAVALRMDDEVVGEARIVLGAVASQPREAVEAAQALAGQRPTRELIAHVADLAAGPARPLDNTDHTHPYRKRMTRVFVARGLGRLVGLEDAGPAVAEVA